MRDRELIVYTPSTFTFNILISKTFISSIQLFKLY